jgi:hypothetical protein
MPPTTPPPAALRALSALALAVLATCIGGCLTADGTLQRDGTGTLALSFQAPEGANEAAMRALVTAPGVTVESFTQAADRTVSAKLKVADVAAISKIPLLKNVTVTDAAEGDARVLTIKTANPDKTEKDKTLPGPKIRLTLPGKVLEASAPGKTDGNKVEWSFTLAEWLEQKTQTLRARYQAATAGAPAADKEPQKPAKPAKPGAKTK